MVTPRHDADSMRTAAGASRWRANRTETQSRLSPHASSEVREPQPLAALARRLRAPCGGNCGIAHAPASESSVAPLMPRRSRPWVNTWLLRPSPVVRPPCATGSRPWARRPERPPCRPGRSSAEACHIVARRGASSLQTRGRSSMGSSVFTALALLAQLHRGCHRRQSEVQCDRNSALESRESSLCSPWWVPCFSVLEWRAHHSGGTPLQDPRQMLRFNPTGSRRYSHWVGGAEQSPQT
jgi:hypothetical protein